MSDKIGIDFSAAQIDPKAIKAAGITAVINYVSEARPSASWMKAVKPMSADYAARLRAEGIEIVSNYQFGKTGDPTPSDWRGGYEAGKRHGQIALANHWKANGAPWRPCYAPCDDNPTPAEVENYVLPFIKGWAEVWGEEWTGIYCNAPTWDQLKKLGAPVRWFWQHNWDGRSEHPHHPDAHMHQVRIDKDKVGGVGVDWNILLKDDYGQWSRGKNPNPIETFPIRNLIATSGVGRNKGNSGRLRIYIHSSEGKDWSSTAVGTMQYQASSQTGSYHYLIDDNEIIQCIALNDTAWAVLSDNPVSINVCLVISSGASGYGPTASESKPKSRAQWLEHKKMLSMLRFLIDHICRETGIPKTRVDIAGVGANKRGVSSHHNYTYGSVKLKGFKDGTHWDVPDTFPHDWVLEGDGTPPPPPDPDAFPLPAGWYYGPLEGPTESISGRAGEQKSYIDGLKRWQTAVGIPASGVWDAATERVARQLQAEKKWPNSRGYVYKGEWDAVIRQGWKPTPVASPTPDPVVVTPTPNPTPTDFVLDNPNARRCMPVAEGTYQWGSPYGNRSGGFHDGQDFPNVPSSAEIPVYAAQAGIVLYAGAASGYGGPSPAGWVVIDHDDLQGSGCTEYGHVVAEVKPGDLVRVGQRIAHVNTNRATYGDSTGPHLHFRVWPYAHGKGRGIDPKGWLNGASKIVPRAQAPVPQPTPAPAPVPQPTPAPAPAPNPPAKAGPAFKVGDLTGPLLTDRWKVTATDLGIPTLLTTGEMLFVFGDTFAGPKVGTADWRSPVGLVGRGSVSQTVKFTHAAGGDPNYARQFWNYRHDSSPWRNGGFSTVLPSDVLRVGNDLYLHVMVNRGLGNVLWTEIWKSADQGASWSHMGNSAKFDATMNGGRTQCWGWDYDPDDGYVYIVSTSFKRDRGISLRRVRPAGLGDWRLYENWGWDGKRWAWGAVEASSITPPDERWGELAFRRMKSGQWILGGFLSSKYNLSYRVIESPTANLYTTPLQTLVVGSAWGLEDHSKGRVAQLYGGYILPGSEVDVENGVGLVVSQWKTGTGGGWPYKTMQFRATLLSNPGGK
ncbi:lysin A [Gordonia phage RedWattleHog]|uniref:Lysin A n=1 Tax=Gordonia phage Stormageddon TaxID=2656541 RepID=A0A649VU34_9CAUD|nr:endolysin [Gordonia phage Stormageddon]QGJ95073.1 lysin A [Gordonia phage Stormageddon]QLF83715.1 lysin A [Gordonia phage RedWattleHog]